ncbi:MAG TPA: hypothetical protein VMD49_04730 [Steroidobacteraceae bacterium]|nr:hypothetical protein [Steroidobacteraceae bacterium]
MNTPRVQPVTSARPPLDAAQAPGGPFVINLCSSTTPVALSQPQDPELKRFSFFVSRRLEDGRERFRLHMGFFESLSDAEEWLTVVREVYPGAWAGETPGKRLRAKAATPLNGASAPVMTPEAARPEAPRLAPAPVALPPPAAPSQPAPARSIAVARPAATPRPAAAARPTDVSRPAAATHPAAAPRSPAVARTAPAEPGRALAAKPQRPQPPTLFPAPPGSAPKRAPMQPGAARAGAPSARAASAGASSAVPPNGAAASAKTPKAGTVAQLPFSNVREVLRSLDETGSTQQMPALDKMPTFEKAAPNPEPGLSDSQVLRLLETRRGGGERGADDRSISILKPDDTGTRRELREAVATNAPVSFAVQLLWSVQPIEIAKVPPLAIFSAYTLYTVEGSREGRRWYGLRLGFFGDAISAKQVAQYVRSEFAAVAVVPVGAQERDRATTNEREAKAKVAAPAAAVRNKLPAENEFKLIEESQAPPAPVTAAQKERASLKAQAASPQKRSAKGAGRVRAREKRSPQTLEETLEILGADQLEIDEGRGERLNDTGVRHLKMERRKESPFMKLLDRLAERARKTR